MSIEISKLVWAYGPKAALPKMLLLAIAEHANDDGVAWPGADLLASKIARGDRTVRRLQAGLESDGWLMVQRRSSAVNTRAGLYERRGNTYQINLAKLRGALPTRQGYVAAAGATGRATNRSTGQGNLPVAGAVDNERRADISCTPSGQNVYPERTSVVARADKTCVPLMNRQEPPENHHGNTNHPLPLPPGEDCGKTSNGQSADQEQKQKATARATATATTPVLRASEVSIESGGQASMSPAPGVRVGGKVIPFGWARRDADPRAGLEGSEAAFYDETMSVLGACGIAPKNVTRRQCSAVTEALRQQVKSQPGCSIADAGRQAVETWEAYLKTHAQGLLWKVVGVQKFFAEGYWLENGHPWDWDKAALAERKRQSSAGMGMYRG